MYKPNALKYLFMQCHSSLMVAICKGANGNLQTNKDTNQTAQ